MIQKALTLMMLQKHKRTQSKLATKSINNINNWRLTQNLEKQIHHLI